MGRSSSLQGLYCGGPFAQESVAAKRRANNRPAVAVLASFVWEGGRAPRPATKMADLFRVSRPLPQESCDELLAWCLTLEFQLYPFRGRFLKRSPKLEWRLAADVGTYRWGQERRSQEWGKVGFPPLLQQLVDAAGDPDVNHVIVISYTDGELHHIPFHSDKQEGVPGSGAKDIVAGTLIHNFVVCDSPRVFQLAPTGDLTKYFFNRPLLHGEMLTLTAKGNRLLQHRVPKEPGWKGRRFSIVLRRVRTIRPEPPRRKRPREEAEAPQPPNVGA